MHITVDIAADEIKIYNNGTLLPTTDTVDFGTDTAFANTDPAASAAIGTRAGVGWYSGKTAFVGMYNRVLTTAEMLMHARAGGFA